MLAVAAIALVASCGHFGIGHDDDDGGSSGPGTATNPPTLSILEPANALVTQGSSVVVKCSVTPSAPLPDVSVNGIVAHVESGVFVATVPLEEGVNVLVATASNPLGTASDGITVRRDTDKPKILIETPLDKDRFAIAAISVAGIVNDIVPGATVNADDVTVTVNGMPAAVMNHSFFLDGFPLALGDNTIAVQAMDAAGNTNTTSIVVSYELDLVGVQVEMLSGNAQHGAAQATLPDALVVRLKDKDGVPFANRPLQFDVVSGDGLLGNPIDNNQMLTLLTDAQGMGSATFTLGRRTGAGFHRVRASTPGSLTFVEFCATVDVGPPAELSINIPPPGRALVGQELTMPLSTIVTDADGNPASGVPIHFTVEFGGGTLSGLPSFTALTNLDGIAEAPFTLGPNDGVANNRISANFDGNPGFPAVFTISGIKPGPPAQTRAVGTVFDATLAPLVGARVSLDGTSLETLTDDQGAFVLSGANPGSQHLRIEGSAANDATAGLYYANIVFELEFISGADNGMGMPIILPFVDVPNGKMVGGDEDVILPMQGVPGFTIKIFAHSTTSPNGVKEPVFMTSSQVKFDKLPMIPPQGSTALAIGTLQPGGIHFDPPARMTYPNYAGLKPGDTADMFAFHHDIGQFVNIGPGVVSDDGSVVTSKPGFGIVQSGWHCLISIPGPKATCANDCKASLSWTITKNGSGSGSDGPIVLCANDDPMKTEEVQITVTFSPASGSFDSGSQWSIGDTTVASFVGGSGATSSVTVRALKGGSTLLTSPLYRIPKTSTKSEQTCQAQIQLDVYGVQITDMADMELMSPVDTERVAVKTQLRAKINPASATVKYKWSVGGDAIKTYEHDIDEASEHKTIALASADKDKQDISFFWTDETAKAAVSVEVEIDGRTCKDEVEFAVKQTDDPNHDVYTRPGGDPKYTPNGEMAVYEALASHGNWHAGADMADGEPPVGTGSEGYWGNGATAPSHMFFSYDYNGSAFFDWHKAYIDAHLAWRNTFHVGAFATDPIPLDALHSYLTAVPPLAASATSRLYRYVRLGEFQTLDELGRDTVTPWHNGGHTTIAGQSGFEAMNFEGQAPSTIKDAFWRWHTIVDGVRTAWSTDQSTVVATVPGNATALTAAPTQVHITFDKKVSFNAPPQNTVQLTAAALKVNGVAASAVTETPGSTTPFMRYSFDIAALPPGPVLVELSGTASYAGASWTFTIAP